MQNQNSQQLDEGLRSNDLQEMIQSIFEVDVYRSKMGEDRDVCVLSFTSKDRGPAKDMMEFIEKGYNFVLDADVSAGENNNGEYTIFVELKRSPELSENIQDLTYGIRKLTGINEWKFKYHKQSESYDISSDTLESVIPLTPDVYEKMLHENKVNHVKQFFSKTLMDDLTIDENSIITIHKPFDQKIQLRWLEEADLQQIDEGAISVDHDSMSEVFWLTKVMGDYNITKVQDQLLFTNNNEKLILQRI